MKLENGVEVYANGKKFVGEIPDELAAKAGLIDKPPKKSTPKKDADK